MSVFHAVEREAPSPVAPPGDAAWWIELRTMSRGNWTWLVDLPPGSRALELAPSGSMLPGALAGPRGRTRRQSRGATGALGHPGASLDCVLLHDGLPRLTLDDPPLLAECARVLRRGGWLFASGENPLALASLRRAPRQWLIALVQRVTRRASLDRAAREAGFVEVRRLYAWPGIEAPRMLIPATRAACAAHERLERKHSNRGPLRARLARLGLHALLYPAEVILCRR